MRVFGDIFYSEYFKSDGVVVNYINDKDWYFVLQNQPHVVLKAQTTPDQLQWKINRFGLLYAK